MKIYLFIATALAALASCSDDTFVGETSPNEANGNGAISFNSSSRAITRSDVTTADKLKNNFVVFGYKTVSDNASTVFNNYQVNWVTNTAGTTESNSANWEYVSYKNLPFGTTTASGETLNDRGVQYNATTSTTNIEQSIKYWDFSARAYDFFAYSLGTGVDDNDDEGEENQYAKASAMSTSPDTYTLEGTAAQLGTCYISNKNTVVPSASATEVDLEFRSFLSQIQLMFYETIPGYSVKNVQFYPSADGTVGTTPYLYASSNDALPTGGKYTVTFDDNGKAQVSFDATAESKTFESNIGFSSTLTNYGGVDYKEDSNDDYLGRESNNATSTNLVSVLPNPDNTNALHLKMDFTLVSRDGSGEEISCTGATAVIPAGYAMWKPNYNYTYIFKISDNTNATIGYITGLYPITLDAIVTDAADGTQETITTVADPSITTYAKGTMVTDNDEYLTGANIYIVVNNGDDITAETDAKLYTAAITLESRNNPRPAIQGITEETVANALAHLGTVTDANGATLTVTEVSSSETDKLQDIPNTGIPATDSPNGEDLVIDGVWFTPSAPTSPATVKYYVFEYSSPAKNYTADEAAAYNATLPGAISTTDVAYTFTSYGKDGENYIEYGTGKVKVITKDDTNNMTTVLVTANSIDGFVGKTYIVKTTTVSTDTYYELFTTKDTETGTGIFVKIASTPSSFSDEEVKTYNATLSGAKTISDVNTPAAKHYKVIKVVAAGS